MRLNYRTLLPVIAVLAITTITSCKKDASNQQQVSSTDINTHTDDESVVSSQMDAGNVDVNNALQSTTSLDNTLSAGVTVTYDTANAVKKLTLNYSGDDISHSRTRSGAVVVTIPAGVRWQNAGAALTITYNNVKVTRKSDNKSVTINGTYTLTNVSGGLLITLASSQPVVHTLTSNNMTVTFSDGTQRSWNVARKTTYSYNGGIVMTIEGTHTDGSQANIAEWGTDRFGRAFTTLITTPIQIKQSCDFRITAGVIQQIRPNAVVTITLGLTATGDVATTYPGATGYYYFKLVIVGITNPTPLYTIILPY